MTRATLTLILPLVLLAAAPAVAQQATTRSAQSSPASSGRAAEDLTRDLNSGPPFAVTPRQTPANPPGQPTPKPVPTEADDAAPAVGADDADEAATLAEAESLRDSAQEDGEPVPALIEPALKETSVAEAAANDEDASAADADAVVEDADAEQATPPPPPVEPLTTAERAALPFTLGLPAGFEIVARPAGPQAAVYSVRGDDRTFVMIYAGPSSQFPIYDGQQAQVAGRTTVVVTESGRRRAMEHLFQRDTAPREIHVWLPTLEGEDAAVAEQIAQTVDPR